MKKWLWLAATLTACSVEAQTTNSSPAHADELFRSQLFERAKETPAVQREFKPNRINVGKLSYSGIFVEVAKTRNPFELFNPAAPEFYLPEDNITRDLITGKVTGLKFFSIRF